MHSGLCTVAAVLLVAAALPGAAGAQERPPSVDALNRALATSDTGAVTGFVEAYYRAAGISVHEGLTWQSQAFDEIVNWYNQYTETIMLSELPRPAEVERYWRNWSTVLTEGRWDPDDFFADPDEARLLANFNQFLLAAHEYGHALTYRYDPEHVSRHGSAINCREYPADRLAAALLEEVAEQDAAIAGLKVRYGQLMTAINAAIAPEHRYETPGFAALDADCTLLDVAQPDETSMTPYASAFFVRQSLLQAEDLPPLADIYETHLLTPWRAAQQPAAEGFGPVNTVAALPGLEIGYVSRGEGDAEETGRRRPGFASDGSLYVLQAYVAGEPGTVLLDMRYEQVGGVAEDLPSLAFEFDNVETEYTGLEAVVPLGPDRFVALFGSYLGLSGDALVVFARKEAGAWRAEALAPFPGEEAMLPQMVGVPGGGVAIFATFTRDGAFVTEGAPVLLEPFEAYAAAPYEISYDLLVMTETMGIVTYNADNPTLVAESGEGDRLVLAGNRLQGSKDAERALDAEFVNIAAAALIEGSLRVLDYDLVGQTYVLRDIGIPAGADP